MKKSNYEFAIVVSEFNQTITSKLLAGAIQRLAELSYHDVATYKVPGAVEIPLTAKLLAKTKKFDAIICLGAVIRGDTDHYDYVCQQVSNGCQQVMLEHEIPIIFGVLTTNNEAQAEERIGGKEGHKGIEAADAAIHMVNVVNTIQAEIPV